VSALEKLKTIEADYWDCDESTDSLSHDDPQSALEEHLDGWLMPHDSRGIEAQIWEIGPVKIWPWHRQSIDAKEVERLTKHLLEEADEWLCENTILADPEGGDLLSKQTREKHQPAMAATVAALCADASVWHCERGEAITLTADEVIALLREQCPEWFEKEAT